MKNNTGKVFLIGAGPGDPGLITLRGKELLATCDVVIYDALVHPLLTATLPHRVRKHFVGKRGGEASTPQSAINRLLVREARNGNRVARLKGGDPLVLGRGSEEMEYLRAHGIPYEVVPGVSSALAAPACAGIPVTHRTLARSVAIVTGHLQEGETIDTLTFPTADTLVFLMAMGNIAAIVSKLLSSGTFTRATPAAIVRNGTLPDQQVVTGTLATIVALKERHRIDAPAALIVGKTAAFARSLAWYKRLPLAGTRVAVLRTPEQSETLLDELYTKGATVVPWPIIRIKPRTRALKRIAADMLRPLTMVIFTSPNGARLFMAALRENRCDARALFGKRIVALGPGTAAALATYGIIADIVPRRFIAEGILDALPDDLSHETILIPRASIARDILPIELQSRGAHVTVLPIYDTVIDNTADCPVEDGDYVLFTSSSTAEAFFRHPQARKKRIRACCMGPIAAATVRQYHKGTIHVAPQATVPTLIATLTSAVTTAKKTQR